jgi:hypothetical protein
LKGGGARWSGWSRPCATSRKVAGSIPNGINRFFNDLILPAALRPWEATQVVTQMSNRGKGGRCVGLTTLSPSCVECLEVLGNSTSWNPLGPVQDCNGIDISKEEWKKNHKKSLSLSLSTSSVPTSEYVNSRTRTTVCTKNYFYVRHPDVTKIHKV